MAHMLFERFAFAFLQTVCPFAQTFGSLRRTISAFMILVGKSPWRFPYRMVNKKGVTMTQLKRRAMGFVLCAGFVLAALPATIAYAGNSADTPYIFNLAYNASADTEWRAKYDPTSSYINCQSNTGVTYVQSNGAQKGSVYTWGPTYPVGIGSQYLINYVWENRPEKDVSAYCFLRFHNYDYNKVVRTQGLWSPDSV